MIACDALSLSGDSLLQAGSSTDALSSQTAALSSNSSDQLMTTLDSKLYIGGSGPTPADASLAVASTNGHLSEGKQGGDYRATCMRAHWPSVCPLTSQAPAVTALKVHRLTGCQFRDKDEFVCMQRAARQPARPKQARAALLRAEKARQACPAARQKQEGLRQSLLMQAHTQVLPRPTAHSGSTCGRSSIHILQRRRLSSGTAL